MNFVYVKVKIKILLNNNPLDFDYGAGNILTNFKKFTSNRNFIKHNMSQKNCNKLLKNYECETFHSL
ncbi:hypothetical protein BpHYR1_036688 [Brachionus plicatilis]|uniref:Uncharacterized protein n=1 Tax=Brachionus plicatilis TaxID=10195 RepID=A0A3M7SIZ6_BRAPC|nr:hypothetical protein BpHYR1_036688 [Brachionus plicatilis]